jgi:glycosyltransferase involved in cell wall biosynthesis
MKIAYFVDSLLPNTDGVSRTFNRLFETLEADGIDFRIYSPFKPGTQVIWSHRVRRIISAPFLLYTKYKISLPFLDNPWFELNKFQPDIIHVSSPTFLGLYGVDYGRRRRIPVVGSYHTHFVSYLPYYRLAFLDSFIWWMMRQFYNRCSATYAPSESAAQEIRDRGFNNVGLWQRGIDSDHFSPIYRSAELRKKLGADERPLLLFVGRLVKEKDLDDLLEACQLLNGQGNQFRLAIVGDGPMREEIQKRTPEAWLPGYLHGQELAEIYASSDIFVFPSTTETFGNVVQEAFASGVPVVGVRSGGVADLITDGKTGFLAAPNNAHDFADKTARLLSNETLRREMGAQALTEVENRSWDAVHNRLLDSYRQVIKRYQASGKKGSGL